LEAHTDANGGLVVQRAGLGILSRFAEDPDSGAAVVALGGGVAALLALRSLITDEKVRTREGRPKELDRSAGAWDARV